MTEILEHVSSLINEKKPRAVAIDGCAAAGKSTLAGLLAERFDCNVIHMDDFFLPLERKTAGRLSEPGGNVDYERFRDEVTKHLMSDSGFVYRRYNCKTGAYTHVEVTPKPLTVVEGVYSLRPLLRDVFDLKLFLRVSAEEQRRRILARAGEFMLERFVNEWIPLENMYFAQLNIEKLCDMVFDTTVTC